MSLVSIEASIKTETARNAKLATDIDNFRNRYIDIDNENNIEVIFPSFEILTFEKNFFVLLNASQEVPFVPRWYMRPDYVSYDFYNTTIYWPLIMYVNNIYTREEFIDFDTILVPPYQMIFQLFNDRQIDRNLIPLNEFEPQSNVVNKFYRKYPLDKLEAERLQAQQDLLGFDKNSTMAVFNTEKTEIITLTANHIKNKYIDLQRIPSSASTIVVKLNNYNIAQRYNYDYTLMPTGEDLLKRISWKNSDVINNSGNSSILASMGSYLRAGNKLTITYAVSIVYRVADGVPSV